MKANIKLLIKSIVVLFLGLTVHLSWAGEGGLPGTGDLDFNPAGDTEDNHCILPPTLPNGGVVCGSDALKAVGCDLNEFFGIKEKLVGGICGKTVEVGQFYVPNFRWVTNACFEESDGSCGPGPLWSKPPGPGYPGPGYFPIEYPEGYTPTYLQPMDDFLSKVVAIKFVVDGQKTYVFPAEDILRVYYGSAVIPDTIPAAIGLPKLPPLSPSRTHTLDLYYIMNELHCDGFKYPNGSFHCLAEGESFYSSNAIEFVKPQ